MTCKNCGEEREEHYVSIKTHRRQKLKNVYLWCYGLNKSIKPTDKRYMIQFEDDTSAVQEASHE